MLLHHPLMWVQGSGPIADEQPTQSVKMQQNPLSWASYLPFPALPSCWKRARDHQIRKGLVFCNHYYSPRTHRWSQGRLVSHEDACELSSDSSTGISLLTTNAAAHFLRDRCALVPADQAVCCSPRKNDLSDNAVSPVPPSSTFYTNWHADKFCPNRKNYFSITVIFPFSPIILLCILHCALGPAETQNNVRFLSKQQY